MITGIGVCGLQNVGNTCFVNVCAQILGHTKEVVDIFQKHQLKTTDVYDPDCILAASFLDIWMKFQHPQNHMKTIVPHRLIQAIRTVAKKQRVAEFETIAQSDVAEFLLFVVDALHRVKKREIHMEIVGTMETSTDKIASLCYALTKKSFEKDYSEIWNLFFAIQIMEILPLDPPHQTNPLIQKPEFFFILDLPIVSNQLIPCFQSYVQGEHLSGDNAWFCEEQQRFLEVRKRTVFWSFPTLLVICLKRFLPNNTKNRLLVDFPLTNFDLSSFVVGYKKETFVYDLYAVCNHIGTSLYGGHYTTFIKIDSDAEQQNWCEFDDQQIRSVTSEKEIISSNAYILFYRKKKTI